MKIKYNVGARTPAGWRQVEITATAKAVSEKMIEIVQVLDVDGHGTAGYASRTGANRQKFNVGLVAGNEEGKKKRLSSVWVIEEAEA